MKSSQRGRDEDVTVANSPEGILRDGPQITTSSSAATGDDNQPIAPQSLEAALEEVAKPVTRAEG